MSFRDLFSERASLYAAYRPLYPRELFEYLASLAPQRVLAWDCATGNGQAATGLAKFFERVIATDASSSQIACAVPAPGVEYAITTAYESGIPDASTDLITVAQAAHWFDLDEFYREARRVLKAGGAIAIWGYGDPVIDEPAANEIVRRYNRGTLESYWHPERWIVLDGYKSISFPFEEIAPPNFTLESSWSLPELCGYLRTWSATARYASEHGSDPVIAVEEQLKAVWGEPSFRRSVTWPLSLRAGHGD